MKSRYVYIILCSCLASFLFPACSGRSTPDDPLNAIASLPPAFQFGQKGYKVLTSFFNKKTGSVAMLFGNDKAKQASMDSSLAPAGAEWALITWKTVADKHWFGADIPGELISVETVVSDAARPGTTAMKYTRYSGKDLAVDKAETAGTDRIKFIRALQPAIMP